MKKAVIGATAVSILALVLSIVSLLSGAPSEVEDAGPEREGDVEEHMRGLNERIAALEERLDALASKQTDLAGQPEKTRPAQSQATLTPKEIAKLVDERSRDAILDTLGRIRMRPDKLPKNVREVATGLIPGSPIVGAELRRRDGQDVYRLRTRFDDENYDIRIAADARVLRAEIPAVNAPKVVNEAVKKAVPGIDYYWMTLEMDNDEGGYVYDVEGKVDKKKYDVLVTPDGHVIEVDGPGGKKRFERGDAPEGGAGQAF